MKKLIARMVRNLIDDQRGQILPWVALFVASGGFFALGGMTVDVGRGYVASAQLQSLVNSEALAAAGAVYNNSTSSNNAQSYANAYSAVAGQNNNAGSAFGTLPAPTVTYYCVNALAPGGSCGSTPVANAIKVTQTASIPTYFMQVFGRKSLTITNSALASMVGVSQPWNVAVIVDATASMSDAPPSGGSCTTAGGAATNYSTEFACEMGGVATLLGKINPCAGVQNCSNSNANFHVALFSFPNVSTASVSDEWTCSGSPTNEPYTFPATNLTDTTGYETLTYSGTGANPTVATTYEDTPTSGQFPTGSGNAAGFVSDYYSGSASNNLSTSSDVVKSVTGCMKNPGGESTYYGGVIYAAQAALLAQQELMTNAGITSKNAMIILTDGQANVTSTSKLASGTPSAGGLKLISSPSSSTGYYPSAVDQCQQAIMAAQAAQNAGTTVYTVAFGSESSGCTTSSGGTDSSLIATATSGQAALSLSTLSPCIVMENMASPPDASGNTHFYADSSSASNGCTDAAHTVSSIGDIFGAITTNFLSPGLLPANSSGVVVTN